MSNKTKQNKTKKGCPRRDVQEAFPRLTPPPTPPSARATHPAAAWGAALYGRWGCRLLVATIGLGCRLLLGLLVHWKPAGDRLRTCPAKPRASQSRPFFHETTSCTSNSASLLNPHFPRASVCVHTRCCHAPAAPSPSQQEASTALTLVFMPWVGTGPGGCVYVCSCPG